jgi:hypothetical protein
VLFGAGLAVSTALAGDTPFAALVDGHRLAAVTGVGSLVAAALCAWRLAPARRAHDCFYRARDHAPCHETQRAF